MPHIDSLCVKSMTFFCKVREKQLWKINQERRIDRKLLARCIDHWQIVRHINSRKLYIWQLKIWKWIPLKLFLPECLVESLNGLPGESIFQHEDYWSNKYKSNFIYERFFSLFFVRLLLIYIIRKLLANLEPSSLRYIPDIFKAKTLKNILYHELGV